MRMRKTTRISLWNLVHDIVYILLGGWFLMFAFGVAYHELWFLRPIGYGPSVIIFAAGWALWGSPSIRRVFIEGKHDD